jgi:hypothetical protein
MKHRPCQERVREPIDTDPPDDVLERMALVDAELRTVANRPTNRCGAIRASMSAALDGEASLTELDDIRRHSEACSSCRRFLAVAEKLATTLRRAPAVRPHLRLVSARPDDGSTRQNEEGRQEVKLSALELDLIYRSLEAARTLRIVPPQDELLEDTIQLVDQALRNA